MTSASASTTAPAVHQTHASEKNFSPLVKQFLDYLKLERHFSDYTVKSYGADLIATDERGIFEVQATPLYEAMAALRSSFIVVRCPRTNSYRYGIGRRRYEAFRCFCNSKRLHTRYNYR